jgi:flagellar biosynthesis/type III secretory pathway protein FliH
MSDLDDGYAAGYDEGRDAGYEDGKDSAAAEIARLRAALIQIRAVCEDNPNMANNFIDEVARAAIANSVKGKEP